MNGADSVSPKQIYLDVCVLCRPFDDQQQVRIRLETNAVELILAHIRHQTLELVVSSVHHIEIRAITDREERQHLLLLLSQLGSSPQIDVAATRKRAEQLVDQGMGVADATHVAFAEASGAEFVTVDDRLLKQCHRLNIKIWCGTPLAYCEKENLQ